MPTHIFGRIMNTLRARFDITPGAEVTIESNPGTLDTKRLHEFIDAGVNRLSIGVQSLDDEKLKFLGRRHNVADARRLIDSALDTGIRVSGDFIYGMPGDVVDTVRQMCNDINKIGLRHVSMYELTIEENTPFGKMNLDMPSNDEMAEMYATIAQTLSIPRYEVSNYAAPGDECQHNQNIWNGEQYIGIGRGAAGRVLIDGQWYQQMGGGAEFIPISNTDRAIESVITGMRCANGIKLTNGIADVINMQYVDSAPELLTRTNDGRIAATDAGMLILDDVLTNMIK